jgi:hypothetical protein
MLLLNRDHPVPVNLRKGLFDGDCPDLRQLFGFDTTRFRRCGADCLLVRPTRPWPPVEARTQGDGRYAIARDSPISNG